jgi:hypothetical protein
VLLELHVQVEITLAVELSLNVPVTVAEAVLSALTVTVEGLAVSDEI